MVILPFPPSTVPNYILFPTLQIKTSVDQVSAVGEPSAPDQPAAQLLDSRWEADLVNLTGPGAFRLAA